MKKLTDKHLAVLAALDAARVPLTTAAIEEATGLERKQVVNALARLRTRGAVQRLGSGKGKVVRWRSLSSSEMRLTLYDLMMLAHKRRK